MSKFNRSIAVLVVFFFGCSIDPEPLTDDWREYEYFPMEIGKEWIYQLDSIIFDPVIGGIAKDTFSYLLKVVVRDTFTDLTGEKNYIIDRYLKKAAADPWVINSVWQAVILDNQAQRVENNLRFVKLVFPPKEGAAWDGNQYFNPSTKFSVAGESIEVFKNWSYFIQSNGIPDNVNDHPFDRVVTVVQSDDENAIEKRYSMEKYAFGIGLIDKEMIILDTQNITDMLSWEEKAEKGFILKQSIISYK